MEELVEGIKPSTNGIACSPEKLRGCILQLELLDYLR